MEGSQEKNEKHDNYEKYDIIIVGAGTAGLSAAIYGVRTGKKVLVLEAMAYGGQIINTPDIENYPGIAHVSGFDFATGLYEQALELGALVRMERVLSLEEKNGKRLVKASSNVSASAMDENANIYETKAVILATGAKNRPLGLDNEQELVGRGVSYCATCDGMFFRNRAVAVNGGGNTALEDARFLANYCSKVYVIHRRDEFRADHREVKKLSEKDNVELVLNSTVSEIISDEAGVKGVRVLNKITGESRVLEVSGLFIAIGQAPDNTAFKEFVELDDKGYIISGEDCLTSTPWIFVAGDCRTKTVRQLTTAASDGAVAALAAAAYIDESDG